MVSLSLQGPLVSHSRTCDQPRGRTLRNTICVRASAITPRVDNAEGVPILRPRMIIREEDVANRTPPAPDTSERWSRGQYQIVPHHHASPKRRSKSSGVGYGYFDTHRPRQLQYRPPTHLRSHVRENEVRQPHPLITTYTMEPLPTMCHNVCAT
jgi:hypothetical protein